MKFKEWLSEVEENPQFAEVEIANMYFGQPQVPVLEILDKTGLTRRQFYEMIRRFGTPNRLKTNHRVVLTLADQGMPLEQIAQATNYSKQNVKYILRTNAGNRK